MIAQLKKIKILGVSHASIVETNRALYIELAKRGFEVGLVYPEQVEFSKGQYKTADPNNSNLILGFPLKLKRKNARLIFFKKLGEVFARFQPDIVLVESDPVSFLAAQAAVFCWRGGKSLPICFTYENWPRKFMPALKRAGILAAFYSLVLQFFNLWIRPFISHVFVYSSQGEEVFRELGYQNRITKIPAGYHSALFFADSHKGDKTRTELGSSGLTIAYFGRMQYQKGVHVLIEALGLIKDLPWTFLMNRFVDVDQIYMKRIEKLINRFGFNERIRAIQCTHSTIANYMRAADIAVVPSITLPWYEEQYGRVAAEAMACGSVVVVSDSGALPQVVGKDGIVVPQNNPIKLAEILRELLNNKNFREEKKRAAIQRAQNELSLDITVKKITDVLLKCK